MASSDQTTPLSFAHPRHRVRALFRGHLIADTAACTVVRGEGEPDRHYFPREDVEMVALRQTQVVRQIAGGGARYFTVNRDASVIEQAAWSLEHPDPAYEDLRGLITFDLAVVAIEEDDAEDRVWDAQAQKMSDYIRHTDSGSGRSQEPPWPSTLAVPAALFGEDDEIDDRL